MMSRGTVLALSGGSFLLVFAIVLSIFGSGAVQNQGKALIGGPFELTTAHGEKKTDRDFRGKLTLVMFGYTNCPDVCPTELQTVSQALDKLGKSADDVNAVFITVDPERDTSDV